MIDPPDYDDLLSCAEKAATTAGLHALRQHHRRNETVRISSHDIKLKLDFECQAIAEEVIRERFPEHQVLGEESGRTGMTNAPYLWIIDPIDGTVNFFHGLPLWCSSVALMENGVIVAGAVYAPVLDECYTARTGKQSRCNGKPITVSKTEKLKEAVIATGIDRKTDGIRVLDGLARHARRALVMGAAALDICHVACGKIDGYYESGIFLWDVAAGSLIVKQAGGCSEFLRQNDDLQVSFMAANTHIHAQLKRIIVSPRTVKEAGI